MTKIYLLNGIIHHTFKTYRQSHLNHCRGNPWMRFVFIHRKIPSSCPQREVRVQVFSCKIKGEFSSSPFKMGRTTLGKHARSCVWARARFKKGELRNRFLKLGVPADRTPRNKIRCPSGGHSPRKKNASVNCHLTCKTWVKARLSKGYASDTLANPSVF